MITKPKSEGGDEGEVGSDIYHFLPPQCLSVPLSTYKIYRLCVCVCESIHRGPQEANSQIDIREDFQKNTFFQMLNVAWGFSAVGRSLAAAQDSCCEDIDV